MPSGWFLPHFDIGKTIPVCEVGIQLAGYRVTDLQFHEMHSDMCTSRFSPPTINQLTKEEYYGQRSSPPHLRHPERAPEVDVIKPRMMFWGIFGPPHDLVIICCHNG